eukprot:748358-Hanusia_phi.AAC.1
MITTPVMNSPPPLPSSTTTPWVVVKVTRGREGGWGTHNLYNLYFFLIEAYNPVVGREEGPVPKAASLSRSEGWVSRYVCDVSSVNPLLPGQRLGYSGMRESRTPSYQQGSLGRTWAGPGCDRGGTRGSLSEHSDS